MAPAREIRDEETQPVSSTPLITPEQGLQRTAVALVLADFQSAQTAREQRTYGKTAKGEDLTFDKWLKELTDLYFQRREPKTVPWQFCSNRSLGIAMAILEVLHARIFHAVYNEELTNWRPTEFTDEEKAERVKKFMFWWVRVHAKLREFFDRWARYCIGYGTVLTVSSWDVHARDTGKMSEETQEVLPDGGVMIHPAEKELDIFETSRSDIIPLPDVYFQPGARDLQRDTLVIKRRYLYRDLEQMEVEGSVVNVTQPSALGIQSLKELLPVPAVASEGMDPSLKEELERIERRNIQIDCLEWYGGVDLDQDGFPEQVRVLIAQEKKVFLGAVAISDLSTRGLRPLDLTQFLPRLDEPTGLLGLGVLEQVKELALEIDAIFNQLTDANSMGILRPGFYRTGSDLDPSAMQLAPNKWIPTAGNPQQDLYIPDFNVRTEPLLLSIRLVLEFIERLTAASAYIMGKESEIVGGSGTATRTEAIVGASNQRHAIPVFRLREGAARILSTHLDLVQKRASEDGQGSPDGFMAMMEKRVLGERGQPIFENNELIAEGLAGEFDAYLLPDESLGSKESERQLAQLLYQTAVTNPLIMSDATKLYKVTADLFKSFGKDPEAYLGRAPDVKQTDRPEDENTMILQGDLSSVQASLLDNHLEHLLIHQGIFQSPVFLAMAPDMQAAVTQFVQAHMQQHMQLLQVMLQQAQSAKPTGGVGNGANVQAPGGGGRRGAGAAPSVGPEPGVGSVQQPAAAAGAVQRQGESRRPA